MPWIATAASSRPRSPTCAASRRSRARWRRSSRRCSPDARSSSGRSPPTRDWWRRSRSWAAGRWRGSRPPCATRRATSWRRSASRPTWTATSRASCSTARPGDTGEAYAFDESGTLLSEVRDTRGLRSAGVLPEGATRAAFLLKLRDPGTELEAGKGIAGALHRRLATDATGGGGARGERRVHDGLGHARRAARLVPQLPRRRGDRRVALAAGRADGRRRGDRPRRSVRAVALRAADARRRPRTAGAHRGLGDVVHARACASVGQAGRGPPHRRVSARARACRKAAPPPCTSRGTRCSSGPPRSRS